MEHTSIKYLKIFANKISSILKDKLVGIYLHGSLAMNFFDFYRSDVDLLIVVTVELTLAEKEKVMKIIHEIEKNGPAKGVEMSIILEKHAKCLTYPLPFLLHYSLIYKEVYLKNPKDFCENMHGFDKDLTSHIMVTYHRGVVLCGKPIKEVFNEPNKYHFIDSIYSDVKYAEDEILLEPIYYTLNLLRVMAYLQNGVILSKGEAIFWGKENLKDEFLPTLNAISNTFLSRSELKVSEKDLKSFASYSLNEIKTLIEKVKTPK